MSRISLLVDRKENRRILGQWLSTRYEVDEGPTGMNGTASDLVLVDGPALSRLCEQLIARREKERPVTLPVLLIASGGEGPVPRWVWNCVDEVIRAPIEKVELHARVEVLLRLRQLSLQLHKRAEGLATRLGRVLDDSPNGIFIFDAGTTRFVQVNHGAARSLGYTAEELLGMTLPDLQPEKTLAALREVLEPLRTGEQDQAVFETLQRRKDGTTFPAEYRIRYSPSESPPVFVAVVQDITERRRAEELEQQAHLRALQDEVEKRYFARDVLCAVTQRKFLLVDRSEVPTEGRMVLDLPAENGPQYRQARHALETVALDAGMSEERTANLVLAVGEAIGNALKHATHGRCQVYLKEDAILVRVSDQGHGMRWQDLPATVLTAGYSTKISLGVGYTLMMKLADQIWLSTGPEGTTVQLACSIVPQPELEPAELLATAMERLGNQGW